MSETVRNALATVRQRMAWAEPLRDSVRDLMPILIVVSVFQVFVFQRAPANLGQLFVGLGLVIVGLALFVSGLSLGLFPVGEQMAHDFATRASVPWLVTFAFALGFGTTFAEPSLIVVTGQAAELTAMDEAPERQAAVRRSYALALRLTVAVAVGTALVVGVLRILFGWPSHYLLLCGYAVLVLLTFFAPRPTIGLAYDIGAVTMSTVTVPLTAALGIGLASSIRGRSPLVDGFGVIALAALFPSLFVIVLGSLWS